jgi:ABC-type polysaccharide/polyol phosphate transport system ATPase subunit
VSVTGSIVFNQVSKKFRRGENHDSLRDLVPALAARVLGKRAAPRTNREFWAVKDVSFEVGPGQAMGIIGHNGAGKSTILKLLTRILKPNVGSCQVKGRIGALIEVAAGFHPDLTGRENVYLQGAIIGLKRGEIARKFDEIVEFAGVGEFIDTPVKRFSSGMNARLGFAIAASLDPEVMIVDEVLSVGDAQFQARCVARMHELRARGVPLVFVSHNLPAVQDLCNTALLLQRGEVVFQGEVGETLQRYRQAAMAPQTTKRPDSDMWIASVQLLTADGSPADHFHTGQPMTIRIAYDTAIPVLNPGFAVDVHRADGVYAVGINTRINKQEFGMMSGAGHVDLEIDALQLTSGCYALSIGLHRSGGIGSGGGIGLYDLHSAAYPFTVTSNNGELGLACLEHTWRQGTASSRQASQSKAQEPGQASAARLLAASKEVAVR